MPLVLTYLTSAYARASDSFIRGEVAQLRALGHTVHTFSVRRSEENELVSDDIRREQANTEYILDQGLPRLLLSALRLAARSPKRMMRAMRLARRLSWPGLKGQLWPLAYLLQASYLAQRLEAKGVQHLHNHIGENSAAVAMLASALTGIPYSLTIHGPVEFDRPTLLALDEKIHHASFIAAISEFTRSQLYRWSDPADWPKIHVIHCGVDESFLDDRSRFVRSAPRTTIHEGTLVRGADPTQSGRVTDPPLQCHFLSIGRLAEQKGQALLMQAAGQLAREGLDFQITLIGDGPLRPQLQRMIEQLSLTNHVRLTGWLSAPDIRREILNSRALVLPSFAEGLPVVIMESLALGRPVIATSIAGIPELVQNGVTGWLIPAGSVTALADAMRRALEASSTDLARMGAAGAALVRHHHHGPTEAAKLAKLFQTGSGSP